MLERTYELETALYRGSLRESELADAISRAKFDLRTAKQTQAEYGGIRALFDRFSGRQAEKAEALARDVRKAEAGLYALLRQQEAHHQQMAALQEQRASLPSLEQLRTPESEKLWAQLECRYCAEVLLPLLEGAEAALAEYRSMLRGEFPILSIERQQAIGTAPVTRAEECGPLLDRLQAATEILGMPLEPGTFFHAPAAYLAAAAKHNQLDRASNALAQTQQLKAALSQLAE